MSGQMCLNMMWMYILIKRASNLTVNKWLSGKSAFGDLCLQPGFDYVPVVLRSGHIVHEPDHISVPISHKHVS